jgi:hypothetical protein
MIIFSSVFIYKKEVIKPFFFKKNRNWFKPTSFDSVILEQKSVLSVYLGFFLFGSVFFYFSIWLGFFSLARFFFSFFRFGFGSIFLVSDL